MRPIRLAYLMPRMEPGGAELQMIALIRYLTANGFEVDVVRRAGAGSLDNEVLDTGARIHTTGQLSTPETLAPVALGRRLSRYVRWAKLARGRYDIVDAWLYPADVEAALSRPLTRVPVVMAARLGRSPRRRFGPANSVIDRLVHRLTDVVVANADVTAADAVAQGVPSDRVRVIRGGVRLPRPFSEAERKRWRASLGATERHVLVGNVGNFRPMKRQDLLIDAFARLLPDCPELRLVLVGDGDLRPEIERQVDQLGLDDRVVLAGTIADMPPLYDALDLFVQASNSEGLPNVLLEASAAGLPIVATAAGGSGELVRDGETGLLVPVDDLDALTSAMRVAVSDARLRLRLGSAARDLVGRDYGMDRFLSEYAGLYREMMATERRRH